MTNLEHVPEWFIKDIRDADWLDEAYFAFRFRCWPGAINIQDAFREADHPITLHEAIAIAAVSEDRKYRTASGSITRESMELLSTINDLLHSDDFPFHGSNLDYGKKQLSITLVDTQETFVITAVKKES